MSTGSRKSRDWADYTAAAFIVAVGIIVLAAFMDAPFEFLGRLVQPSTN